MLIQNEFDLEEIVFLKTDIEQQERIVTAIQLNINGLIYRLTSGTVESWHYGIEISREKKFF